MDGILIKLKSSTTAVQNLKSTTFADIYTYTNEGLFVLPEKKLTLTDLLGELPVQLTGWSFKTDSLLFLKERNSLDSSYTIISISDPEKPVVVGYKKSYMGSINGESIQLNNKSVVTHGSFYINDISMYAPEYYDCISYYYLTNDTFSQKTEIVYRDDWYGLAMIKTVYKFIGLNKSSDEFLIQCYSQGKQGYHEYSIYLNKIRNDTMVTQHMFDTTQSITYSGACYLKTYYIGNRWFCAGCNYTIMCDFKFATPKITSIPIALRPEIPFIKDGLILTDSSCITSKYLFIDTTLKLVYKFSSDKLTINRYTTEPSTQITQNKTILSNNNKSFVIPELHGNTIM